MGYNEKGEQKPIQKKRILLSARITVKVLMEYTGTYLKMTRHC